MKEPSSLHWRRVCFTPLRFGRRKQMHGFPTFLPLFHSRSSSFPSPTHFLIAHQCCCLALRHHLLFIPCCVMGWDGFFPSFAIVGSCVGRRRSCISAHSSFSMVSPSRLLSLCCCCTHGVNIVALDAVMLKLLHTAIVIHTRRLLST